MKSVCRVFPAKAGIQRRIGNSLAELSGFRLPPERQGLRLLHSIGYPSVHLLIAWNDYNVSAEVIIQSIVELLCINVIATISSRLCDDVSFASREFHPKFGCAGHFVVSRPD